MPAERIAAVDIYTCMDFSAEAAVRFTEKWLATPEIEFEEF